MIKQIAALIMSASSVCPPVVRGPAPEATVPTTVVNTSSSDRPEVPPAGSCL